MTESMSLMTIEEVAKLLHYSPTGRLGETRNGTVAGGMSTADATPRLIPPALVKRLRKSSPARWPLRPAKSVLDRPYRGKIFAWRWRPFFPVKMSNPARTS